MPNANDVELVRTFVRPVDGTVGEETINNNQRAEVVVDVEAGKALFNIGGPYRILGVVKDENTGTAITTPSRAGNFGDANWPKPAATIKLTPPIEAQGPGKNNHIYEATVVLVVGTGDPNVDFTDDVLFVITQQGA